MRISEYILVQQVDNDIVVVDESSGQETVIPGSELNAFTRKAHEDAARGVGMIDVDGIIISSSAFSNLFVALTYFAGFIGSE